MTFEEMKSFLITEFGNRPSLGKSIEVRAEFAKVEKLENDPSFKPWFLISHLTALPTVADQNYVELPSDFLSEYEYGFLYDWEGNEIKKDTYEMLTERFRQEDGTQQTGMPRNYAVVNRRMFLFPTPTEVQNLQINYFARTDPLIQSGDDNPWLLYGAEWLMYETGTLVAQSLMHDAKAKEMQRNALIARSRLLSRHFEEEAKNMSGLVK